MTIDKHPDPRNLPHEAEHERALRHRLADLLDSSPIPAADLLHNLALYLRRQTLTDLLNMDALYRMITDIPGDIMEFGVHRGRHLAALTTLRSLHEPHNPHRRVTGFDTFTGFPDTTEIDRTNPKATPGRFDLPGDYLEHLRAVIDVHEEAGPLGHLRRTRIVQGDVRETVPRYLMDNRHTVIALAYFDLDLYEPTRDVLSAIKHRLTKGSIVAFDELAHAKWPGETDAVMEVLRLGNCRFRTLPGSATPAYIRWGE